jgi:hypothetical protein
MVYSAPNADGDPMRDVCGEAIDQLITIEAKNPGMPHNVLRPMYQAARKLAADRPIAMVAAERLVGTLQPGDTVLVLTGAGYAPTMPKGENDGPPGAASLAKVLYKGLSVVPVYACEACHVDPIVAASHAAGLMAKDFADARDRRLGAALAVAPPTQQAVATWVTSVFDEMHPKALITTERLGPGRNGIMHTATALPLQGTDSMFREEAVDISPLVLEANQRGLLTIGLGDHGNELGFGAIWDTVAAVMPKGEILATTVPTEILLPAMMSNWGCYGIEAAIAYLLRRPELIHSPAQEERILRACLDAGGLEAMYCTTEFWVDGLDGETSMACMQLLSNIVRKNLESATTGLTH